MCCGAVGLRACCLYILWGEVIHPSGLPRSQDGSCDCHGSHLREFSVELRTCLPVANVSTSVALGQGSGMEGPPSQAAFSRPSSSYFPRAGGSPCHPHLLPPDPHSAAHMPSRPERRKKKESLGWER